MIRNKTYRQTFFLSNGINNRLQKNISHYYFINQALEGLAYVLCPLKSELLLI